MRFRASENIQLFLNYCTRERFLMFSYFPNRVYLLSELKNVQNFFLHSIEENQKYFSKENKKLNKNYRKKYLIFTGKSI